MTLDLGFNVGQVARQRNSGQLVLFSIAVSIPGLGFIFWDYVGIKGPLASGLVGLLVSFTILSFLALLLGLTLNSWINVALVLVHLERYGVSVVTRPAI